LIKKPIFDYLFATIQKSGVRSRNRENAGIEISALLKD